MRKIFRTVILNPICDLNLKCYGGMCKCHKIKDFIDKSDDFDDDDYYSGIMWGMTMYIIKEINDIQTMFERSLTVPNACILCKRIKISINTYFKFIDNNNINGFINYLYTSLPNGILAHELDYVIDNMISEYNKMNKR